MDNKKVLSKLVKIAHNQQAVLTKLAEDFDATKAENALQDFIKSQSAGWSAPREVAARESHDAGRVSGTKHFDVAVNMALSDKAKKTTVEDPSGGLAQWLQAKFNAAAMDPNSKWKDLAGYTAKFTVTAN